MAYTFEVVDGALSISNGDLNPPVRASLHRFDVELTDVKIRIFGNFGKWDRIFYWSDFNGGTIDGETPTDLEDAYDLLVTAQAEVNQANSPAYPEVSGIHTQVFLTPDMNTIEIAHGLPGANWVDVQYGDPEFSDVYLADVYIEGASIIIFSDNPFAVGDLIIYYTVKIVPTP